MTSVRYFATSRALPISRFQKLLPTGIRATAHHSNRRLLRTTAPRNLGPPPARLLPADAPPWRLLPADAPPARLLLPADAGMRQATSRGMADTTDRSVVAMLRAERRPCLCLLCRPAARVSASNNRTAHFAPTWPSSTTSCIAATFSTVQPAHTARPSSLARSPAARCLPAIAARHLPCRYCKPVPLAHITGYLSGENDM
jgi:hypothetical protein